MTVTMWFVVGGVRDHFAHSNILFSTNSGGTPVSAKPNETERRNQSFCRLPFGGSKIDRKSVNHSADWSANPGYRQPFIQYVIIN